MKKTTVFILLFSIVLSIVGCKSMRTHEFAEFKITLPESYTEVEQTDIYDLTLTNGYATIGINRISRVQAGEANIPDALTPSEFADFYMRKAGVDSQIQMSGDVPYYIYYHTPISGNTQFCLAAFYRSPYAYFTVFCIVESVAERVYISEFIDYIDNVEFKRSIS